MKWLESYLTNRTQSTNVNGVTSKLQKIEYGVPQGSLLGPLLFILYVNDVSRVIEHCSLSLYADDTAVYVHGANTDIIQQKLQSDLNNIANWLLSNKLCINARKCKILNIATLQHRTRNQPLNIHIKGEELEVVDHYKYLGYWLDGTLSFNVHVSKSISKINKRLGFIRNSVKLLDSNYSLMLYKCLVLPLIDYGDVLHHCANQDNLTQLQIIQTNL